MDNRLKLMIAFKKQVVKFVDQLISQFPTRGEFIFVRIFVKDQIPLEDGLGRFIQEVYPYRNLILRCDEKIFTNTSIVDNAILGGDQGTDLDKDNIKRANAMRDLWKSELTDYNKKIIWKWFHMFIRIAEKYYDTYGFVQGWDNIDMDKATKMVDEQYC